MESAAVLRSFHYSAGTASNLQTLLETPGIVTINNATFSNLGKLSSQGSINGMKSVFPSIKRGGLQIACAKTSEIKVTTKAEDSSHKGPLDHNSTWRATFPNAFEELVAEVCDETEIAELKLKVGDFQMHLKRNLATKAPAQVVASPPPSTPVVETASPAAPSQPKASAEKISPFTNVSPEKVTKLAALEASGASGYVLVASPTVGSFRRGRTLKGKKQPPACKQGDTIKEGQVIGFLDQFGTELPVKSDVAGEVLKVLYEDGEAVGYGDPLIAVLPSFHSIMSNNQ